jgi:hypothetical protein
MSHVEELEKALAELDADDTETLSKGGDNDGDGDGDDDEKLACSACGHDGMHKGITNCPKCGASMRKSLNDPAKQQVDITEWLGGIEEKVEKSLGSGDVLAKSQLAIIRLARSQAEQIATLREEVADQTALNKAIAAKLQIILQAPRPRKSVPTDAQLISKGGHGGNGDAAKANSELTIKQKAQWHSLLHKGLVPPAIALAIDRHQISIPDAIEVVQSHQVDIPNLPDGTGGFADRW